jgi:hypothetical protein
MLIYADSKLGHEGRTEVPKSSSYGLKEVVKKKEVEVYSLLAINPMPSLDRTSVGRHSNGRVQNMME